MNEKAACVAFCGSIFFALSIDGILYKMQVNTPNFLFEKVDELKGKKFIQISGTSEHCLAVCNDGSVYGFGLNSNGRLGVGLDKMRISKFNKISSLRNYTILSACAGCDHSLFITK